MTRHGSTLRCRCESARCTLRPTNRIEELEHAFDSIVEELSNQYLVSYPPTNTTREGSYRRITLTVKGDYRLRAREGYRVVRFSR